MTRREIEQAIAADLDMCDMGEVFTKGAMRARYRKHRKACFAEIAKMNREDGLNLTDDELLTALKS